MNIPPRSEISRLLDTSPRTVISFANRLFASEEYSQRELFEIAKKLIEKVSSEDRVHLWEAATLMTRRKLLDAAEDWFFLAKKRLTSLDLTSFEEGTIRVFLGDQRTYISAEVCSDGLGKTPEFLRYMSIFNLGKTVETSGFAEYFDLLSEAAGDESFLVREACTDALCAPCTRSDIDDETLLPFKQKIQSIVRQLSKDDNLFVKESLETAVYFLELTHLM